MLPTIQFSGDEDIRRDKSPLRSHVRKKIAGGQEAHCSRMSFTQTKIVSFDLTNYPSRRGLV
jgi:hypothetical protein